MISKEILRKKYLNIRKSIVNKEKLDYEIYLKVLNHPKVKSSQTILIYASYNNEVDTFKIIQELLKTKNVAIPKIIGDELAFFYIKSLNDLSLGQYNILQPTTQTKVIDFNETVSLTPGICFSQDGYRIGYGKGYYDRFYQKHSLYKIGLCYQACLIDKIPYDKYDIPMNEIIYK